MYGVVCYMYSQMLQGNLKKNVVVDVKLCVKLQMLSLRPFVHGTVFMQLSRKQINVLIANDFALTVSGIVWQKHSAWIEFNMLKISSSEVINKDELAHCP